mmetsp:Transcript_4353/g.11215  ORF Transcript_4353/g.11215 Transcript_4353/m.11215 type:complete len:83 (-) Transcript_4353:130-378(-)
MFWRSLANLSGMDLQHPSSKDAPFEAAMETATGPVPCLSAPPLKLSVPSGEGADAVRVGSPPTSPACPIETMRFLNTFQSWS